MPTAGKANQRTANGVKAKYEEKHATEESGSQPVPDVQQGQHELKFDEGIATIPKIDFNEETVEYKNANYPDSSEAATQKVQKTLDSFSLKAEISEVSSADEDSRDKQKIFTATKEDLEQNATDTLAGRQRQALVIQKGTEIGGCPTASVQ